jgi:hypothetical protein
MSWEKRLRDMALAGGTLAAAACNGSTASPSGTSSPDDGSNVDLDGSTDASTSDAPPNFGPESGGCCNASPDPCCYLSCDGEPGPDAAVTIACKQSQMDCNAMNGFYEPQIDGALGCTPLGGPGPEDASPTGAEAGPGDAGDAGDAHD